MTQEMSVVSTCHEDVFFLWFSNLEFRSGSNYFNKQQKRIDYILQVKNAMRPVHL